MQFTLSKNEIIDVLHKYVDGLFHDSSNVSIELFTKPKSGVCATITVSSTNKVPVDIPPTVEEKKEVELVKEPKKSPPPLETFIVQEDKPEEENKDKVVTSSSLFSKMSS